MSINIRIGNAIPVFSKEFFPLLEAQWQVKVIKNDESPLKNVSNGTNNICISGSWWGRFIREYNLVAWWETKNPKYQIDCHGLLQDDVQYLGAILCRLESNFKTDKNDIELLRWLYFWTNWAVFNCETPAIENWPN